MAKSRILVVDDDKRLVGELRPTLEREGYDVDVAYDGEQALLDINETKYDLVVLDVMLPKMDGREVLRKLRQVENWVPVMLLTQLGGPVQQTLGLRDGADDYIDKPYDPGALIARIEAILRRSRMGLPSVSNSRYLISEAIELDRQTRRASSNGTDLDLTPRAINVLEYLMLNQGEVISRERLIADVWGWENMETSTRAVDNRIRELRSAMQDDSSRPDFIESVIGQGYRFISGVSGRQ